MGLKEISQEVLQAGSSDAFLYTGTSRHENEGLLRLSPSTKASRKHTILAIRNTGPLEAKGFRASSLRDGVFPVWVPIAAVRDGVFTIRGTSRSNQARKASKEAQ